ncbi:Pr6Pr family membrane protein [Streptomyces sp. NPDC059752]|uniref:Pr6Pr family membrane protein n=1 Tax=Streptomyces sp. NPDC059752 TaxID=3346932 RepID=UPI0036511C66
MDEHPGRGRPRSVRRAHLAAPARRRSPLPGRVLLFILITGLVFHLVLANPSSPFNVVADLDRLTGARAVANQLLHTVTPAGALLDFLLLTTPRTLRPRHAALWLAYPLAYVTFALLRGALLAPAPRAGTRTPSSTQPGTATPTWP